MNSTTSAEDLLDELARETGDEMRLALYVATSAEDVDALECAGLAAAVATKPAKLAALARDAARTGAPIVVVDAHDGEMVRYLSAEVPGCDLREIGLPPGYQSVAAVLGYGPDVLVHQWDESTAHAKRDTWTAWAAAARRVDTGERRDGEDAAYASKPWREVADMPPMEWLVAGWIPEASIGVLAGEPEAGKTFVALDLALRMVHGKAWFGREVMPGSVLYLAGEGHRGLRGRLAAWDAQHSPSDAEAQGRYLAVLNGIPPLTKDALPTYCEQVDRHASLYGHLPALVVVDTFSHGLIDGDENDAKAVVPALRLLSDIRTKYGCSVWAVHHLRKLQRGQEQTCTADDVRGHSSIRGNVDGMIGLIARQEGREIRILKVKDGARPEPIHYRLLPVETGRKMRNGTPETSCIVLEDTAPPIAPAFDEGTANASDTQRLVDTARKLGRAVGKDALVLAAGGMRTTRGRSLVELAVADGVLQQFGSDKRARYGLPQEGGGKKEAKKGRDDNDPSATATGHASRPCRPGRSGTTRDDNGEDEGRTPAGKRRPRRAKQGAA